GDFERGLLLNGEDVFQVTIEIIRPELKTGRTINQLSGDPHAIGSFAHAAFEQVANAELAPNLLDVLLSSFEARDRGARSYLKTVNVRELGNNFFGDAIDEVLILRIGTEILEG